MEFTKDINFNVTPTANEDLTITYNGYLNNSDELSIVYGYGDSWENTTEKIMKKGNDGFFTTINLLDYDTLNFCFKNSNNNWDNNSYCNYIVGIAPAINTAPNFDIDTLIEELLLEPVFNFEKEIPEEEDLVEEIEENYDLGYQLSSIISKISNNSQEQTEYDTLEEILTATKIENSNDYDFSLDIPELETVDDNVTASNFIGEDSIVNNSVAIDYYDDVFEEFINNSSIEPSTITDNNQIFDEFIKNLSAITSNTEEKNETVSSIENLTNKIILEPLDDDSFQTVIGTSSKNEETALVNTSDSFMVSSRKLGTFYMIKKKIKLVLYKVFVKIPKLLLGLDEKN